jgi:chromosome segregation ATPase
VNLQGMLRGVQHANNALTQEVAVQQAVRSSLEQREQITQASNAHLVARLQEMERAQRQHATWGHDLVNEIETLRQRLQEQECTFTQRFDKEQADVIAAIETTWKGEVHRQRQAFNDLETQLSHERQEYANIYAQVTQANKEKNKDYEQCLTTLTESLDGKATEIKSLQDRCEDLSDQMSASQATIARLKIAKQDELIQLNELLRKERQVSSLLSDDNF